MTNKPSLFSKLHKPILLLSTLCLILFGATSFFVVESLVYKNIQDQAKATIDIFSNSVREDILNGFDTEVFRKCKSVLKNTLVVGVRVVGLDSSEICSSGSILKESSFLLVRNLYFEPAQKKIAGTVELNFQNHLASIIISRILVVFALALLILFIGYWIVSKSLLRKETEKFSNLAALLSESEISKLEKCSEFFLGKQTRELYELCAGVEKLSANWRAYQSELLENERLKAVQESSRILAHDIKSPLGAIKTVSQTLISKPEVSKKLLDKGIERIEKMLLELVNHDETQKAQKRPTSFNNFLKSLEDELSPQFSSNEMPTLKFNFLEIDSVVNMDSTLIERAARNLIKNATEACSARKGVIRVDASAIGQKVTFKVSDNGPGIPEDLLSVIGSGAIKSSKPGGSGLGIFQVQQAMDLHGGELKIYSEINVGSTFELIFNL